METNNIQLRQKFLGGPLTGKLLKARKVRTTTENPLYAKMGINHIGLEVTDEAGNTRIIHKTDTTKNHCGGNILIDTPDKFFAKRQLLSTQPAEVDPDWLRAYLKKKECTSKYNLFRGNCEQLVSELLTGQKKSPQLNRAASGIAFFLGVALVGYQLGKWQGGRAGS